MKEGQQIALQQKPLSQSREPGLFRKGGEKVMDGATWVSRKTFLPFTAVWGASVVFPGVIPAAIGTGAGIGAVTDGGTLLIDKTRKKDRGGSLPKQGNIFTRTAKGVGGEGKNWLRATSSQLTSYPKAA